MPRSNWKGLISFGLVSIPISLYPSKNRQADISFHQIDKRNNARIKFQRINAETGKIVPWENITRGYEYEKNTIVPVPDEVLANVAGENDHVIDIENFIDNKDLDILTIDNFYYSVPDKKGEKGYVILREALKEAKKIGIAKVIISTKEYVAAVMPYQGALIVCLLKYDEEVKKPSEFDLPTKELSSYKVSKKEIEIAKKLISAMAAKWNPKKYKSEYQSAIHKWVEETVNKLPHPKSKKRATKKASNLVDFVDLLKKSLQTNGKESVNKKVKKKKTIAASLSKTHKILKSKHKSAKQMNMTKH